MKLVIVSGMSGAGKTVALKALEDLGFYCVDNMPISLIGKFCELLSESRDNGRRAAIGTDIRSGDGFPQLKQVLSELSEKHIDHEVLFLDASDRVLLNRYKETRRSHPLSRDGRIEEGIAAERSAISWLRDRADHIIDTSRLLTKDLRAAIAEIYAEDKSFQNLYITVMSFGFKYGLPEDADLVFDVRFLPNPFYVEELKHKTGLCREVRDYVLSSGEGELFEQKIEDMMDFLIPRYIAEGKNQLVIAMGCTGGKHRSVTFAELLYAHLKTQSGYGLKIEHRDLKRA
ncbi:MAG TPA: RNase adapter RapZ [Candidatus Avilachnospira avistercoris]|nr:RNase adapter RapZ [Candidatus Avilachnospira avistercoris]